MKKLCKLVIFLMLAVLLVMPVTAAGGTAALTPDVINVKPGESFSVTVKVEGIGKIDIGTALVSYDAEAFTFKGGRCLVEGTALAQVVQEKNVGTFLLADPKEVSGDIFTFDFAVKETASADAYSIDLKVSVGNGSGSYIDATGAQVVVSDGSTPAPTTPEATTPVDAPDATTPADTPEATTPGAAPETTAPVVDTPGETTEATVDGAPATDAADTDDKKQETPDAGTTEEPGFPWWILLVAAAVAAVVVVIIVRKKKTN